MFKPKKHRYLADTPLEPESDFPYTSGTSKRDGRCRLDRSEGQFEVTSQTQVAVMSVGEHQDMTDYVLNTGPVSVAVHANDEWQTYVGGVLSIDECPDLDQPNHAVQAVAVNADEDEGYWVIRNSWASDWGEDGFIRLSYGENTCNLAWDVLGVEVQKVDDTAKGATSSSSGNTNNFLAKSEDAAAMEV